MQLPTDVLELIRAELAAATKYEKAWHPRETTRRKVTAALVCKDWCRAHSARIRVRDDYPTHLVQYLAQSWGVSLAGLVKQVQFISVLPSSMHRVFKWLDCSEAKNADISLSVKIDMVSIQSGSCNSTEDVKQKELLGMQFSLPDKNYNCVRRLHLHIYNTYKVDCFVDFFKQKFPLLEHFEVTEVESNPLGEFPYTLFHKHTLHIGKPEDACPPAKRQKLE